ncbi:DNA methyltransferase [Pedobacter sp. SYSU D00535]|uniref:DNA methyltransferase n=1 Tax=Pedobacter sp. SYSU D00535 TaxID=2810308 RepID=UPI001A9697D3|nr:DNA methyltransferase [Pedobacter sp. SYSU D00535]
MENRKVICLGKEFTSEDERREYFRNELRIKLPELKKIEGFPIGEDEDIINLSDPPYYTACPNPWLNDFINEWEKEKENISGRHRDFHVDEPYASDVSEGKKNPVYTAHSYHTKVPHPAIARYILHYTQPGDIVLDGFAGTGMTGVAAYTCESPATELQYQIQQEFKLQFGSSPIWGRRNAICSDLSPLASFLSSVYNTSFPLEDFRNEAERTLAELQSSCAWMYETKHLENEIGQINYVVWSDIFLCSNCGEEIVFWDSAVDFLAKEVLDKFKCKSCNAVHEKKGLDYKWETVFDSLTMTASRKISSKPVLIKYTFRGKGYLKEASAEDIELVNRIENEKILDWHPLDSLPEGEKTSEPLRMGIDCVHKFYTKRNLIALAKYLSIISSSKYKQPLLFILTGMIQRSSKMNRMHVKNFFHGGGGWNAGIMKGTIHIPSIPIETSIIEQVGDKIQSFIKAKQCINASGNVVYISSASHQPIPDSSIDYIFTDPPFGANIMYSELNFLWESWLKVRTNNKKEAIQNRKQGKSLLDYQELMTECFQEYYRLLKPGKWMTIEFSNTSAAVWNGIQTALQKAGFIIANVAAIDKKQGGMRSITTATGVRQDLAISCYKPSLEFVGRFSSNSQEVLVWDFVDEHLNHLPIHLTKEGSTTSIVERSAKILYDRLISFYLMKGMPVPIDARNFQDGLKQRFVERDGMYFTKQQAAEYDEKKAKAPQFVQLSLIVTNESDAIEWLKDRLRKRAQKYQDIMPDFRIATQSLRKGDTLPELKDILNENFIQEADGTWRTPDPNEAKDREALRLKVLLKEFNGYVAAINQPKAKKLKEVRVEALRAGFKNSWELKNFKTIVILGDMIPQNILLEDEQLLMYYDIAKDRV